MLVDRARHGRQVMRELRQFRRNKTEHMRVYEPDASRAPDRDLLASFVTDGAVVIPGFLPGDAVEQIVGEIRGDVDALAESRYSGPLRTRPLGDGGVCRMYEPDSRYPTTRAFYESPFIRDLADSLCGDGMHSADRYVDFKVKVGGWDESLDFHIDHWKLRFKAFLLLNDVTEDQAPFVYVVGSHRQARWRERWDWGYQHKETAGSILPPDAVAKICRRYSLEERTYTGNAGDLILADTRGIHRGTTLASGTRLQLVNVFVMNGAGEYAG